MNCSIEEKMESFEEDDQCEVDGIPVEVKLDNGGYFDAFLMDIIKDEALIHFPCNWIPDGKYQRSNVRLPPAEGTPRSALQEGMIAEVLADKYKGFHAGWFKCRIKMLNSEVCHFVYLDSQNDSDVGYTWNFRKPNMNTPISIDMFYCHKIKIPEDLHEYAQCEFAHRSFKAAFKSALVNYHAEQGELLIISRNITDITSAKVLEKAHLNNLYQQIHILELGEDFSKMEIVESDGGFTTEFTIFNHYLDFSLGKDSVHLNEAKNIIGINAVQLIRALRKFIIHGETKEAVREARELLEIKMDIISIPKDHIRLLVGEGPKAMHNIIDASGVAQINIEGGKVALEDKISKDILVHIIGSVKAIQKAKNCIESSIDHLVKCNVYAE